MKAMLFAAGLGTRLRPLTLDKPKALVEVRGVSLLEIAIRRLMAAGCREIIVNVHYFAGQVEDFLAKKQHFGIRIALSDERPLLLDTGGGLKKAAWFFDDGQPFLVCNTDVLTDLDLRKFYQSHIESGAMATLAVRRRQSSRCFLFDEKMHLRGWRNTQAGESRLRTSSPLTPHPSPLSELSFSGIHAIHPGIFRHLPDAEVFSMIDVYVGLDTAHLVAGYPHDDDFWMDVGKPEALAEAEREAGKLF